MYAAVQAYLRYVPQRALAVKQWTPCTKPTIIRRASRVGHTTYHKGHRVSADQDGMAPLSYRVRAVTLLKRGSWSEAGNLLWSTQ